MLNRWGKFSAAKWEPNLMIPSVSEEKSLLAVSCCCLCNCLMSLRILERILSRCKAVSKCEG